MKKSLEGNMGGKEMLENKLSPKENAQRRMAWLAFDNILSSLLEIYNKQKHSDFHKERDIYKFLKKGVLPDNVHNKQEAIIFLKGYLETLLYNDRNLYREFLIEIDRVYPKNE
jgi:hypothetical protein